MAPSLNAIGIVVADMATALAFYRKIGLSFPDGADAAPHAEAEVAGFRVMFDTRETVRSFAPDWTPPTGGHRISLAVQCADPAEVDTLHAELVAAGAPSEMAPQDVPWGQRYAVIQDPDGNTLDLYAPLE